MGFHNLFFVSGHSVQPSAQEVPRELHVLKSTELRLKTKGDAVCAYCAVCAGVCAVLSNVEWAICEGSS